MQASLSFDNRFVADLPGDPEPENFRRQVTGACYSRVHPTAVRAPRLVAFSPETAELLGMTTADCESDAFTQIFSGNGLLDGMDPFAMCYGGHQFGNWAGQLGDGRAINLGEVVNAAGARFTLQLKGAGPTPYSRTADGLAVLRSSLREFVCSEAMHHLGIPTTRALCLTLTGEDVVRDILYDGHPAPEPGAVVCRVAPSFVRFGNFEILAARRELDLLKRLADFTIDSHFPDAARLDGKDRYSAWFDEVTQRTASMIVEWMRVGFVHGVMNTDNMSILGLTIDYGPYGWLEDYDPDWTPNTTDAGTRRYRYGQQAGIAQWNLLQLANAIYPLVGETEALEAALTRFASTYQDSWQSMRTKKLGLRAFEPGDADLLTELDGVLQLNETDMTVFYRRLPDVTRGPDPIAAITDAFYAPESIGADARTRINAWLDRYLARVERDGLPAEERRERMNSINPLYVLRNYLAQLAIDAATADDFTLVRELLEVLRNPYTEQPGRERFAEKRPEWARSRVGCSMLSCSS